MNYNGDVAQLVEHLICIQKVSGSIPLISTRSYIGLFRINQILLTQCIIDLLVVRKPFFPLYLIGFLIPVAAHYYTTLHFSTILSKTQLSYVLARNSNMVQQVFSKSSTSWLHFCIFLLFYLFTHLESYL